MSGYIFRSRAEVCSDQMLQTGCDYQRHDHGPEYGDAGESDEDAEEATQLAVEDYVSVAKSSYGDSDPVKGCEKVCILVLALLIHQGHEEQAVEYYQQ